MDCFLCRNPSAKLLCLSNIKTNEESKICEKCSRKSKSYCSTCGKLDDPLTQIWDQDKNPHCKSCFKQNLCQCGVMSVIMCSCNYFICRKCSIVHFCQGFPFKSHTFRMYQEPQITPDPDFIDSFLIRYVSTLYSKINSMQEFYYKFHEKFRDPASLDYVIKSYSLYKIGYSELATETIKKFSNKIHNLILLELQSYFDPDIKFENLDYNEMTNFEIVNELDRIRIATVVKQKKLEKKDRKHFNAKKLKYAIRSNLCPSHSLLKAITIYFEITRKAKYLDLFIDYVSVHFQGCFELGRLYYVKALILYKQNDHINSDNCFIKSLEIMNPIIYISSPLLNTILFHYAKNLKSLGREDECSSVLMRILSMQRLDRDKAFVKKILDILESLNQTSSKAKRFFQRINEVIFNEQ